MRVEWVGDLPFSHECFLPTTYSFREQARQGHRAFDDAATLVMTAGDVPSMEKDQAKNLPPAIAKQLRLGASAKLIGYAGTLIVRLASLSILARLLPPRDFG